MKIECFSKVNYIYKVKVEWFETLVGKSFSLFRFPTLLPTKRKNEVNNNF